MESRGTILYIGGFELPDKNAAAHRVLSNGKIFRDLGYNIIFLGVDKSLQWDDKFHVVRSNIQGFTCYSSPYPESKRQWLSYLTVIHFFKIIFDLHSDIKAVICYNYQSVALQKILTFCHQRGIKVLADCTEWYSARGTKLGFFILKGIDTWYRMRILHKKLDGLIVISSYLENYYRDCSNVIHIPPLVDLSEKKWQKNCKYQLSEIPKLVYAGSPGDKDNLHNLVKALSDIRHPYSLDIIGITQSQYLRKYQNDKKILKNTNSSICFHGRLNHRDALSFVQQADYSCFFREDTRVTRAGFPTKFIESISCGTPVITNRTSDLTQYLHEGVNGYFIDDNIKISLSEILSKNSDTNKVVKKNMDRTMFDYRNYIKLFNEWCEKCF